VAPDPSQGLRVRTRGETVRAGNGVTGTVASTDPTPGLDSRQVSLVRIGHGSPGSLREGGSAYVTRHVPAAVSMASLTGERASGP
jgi:hypothetical protein